MIVAWSRSRSILRHVRSSETPREPILTTGEMEAEARAWRQAFLGSSTGCGRAF